MYQIRSILSEGVTSWLTTSIIRDDIAHFPRCSHLRLLQICLLTFIGSYSCHESQGSRLPILVGYYPVTIGIPLERGNSMCIMTSTPAVHRLCVRHPKVPRTTLCQCPIVLLIMAIKMRGHAQEGCNAFKGNSMRSALIEPTWDLDEPVQVKWPNFMTLSTRITRARRQ